MPKCKRCGAEIIWIETPAGKSMPCDVKPVYYLLVRKGSKKVVTKRGSVLTCEYVTDPKGADGIGYIPHWGTCPAADAFKKKRADGK